MANGATQLAPRIYYLCLPGAKTAGGPLVLTGIGVGSGNVHSGPPTCVANVLPRVILSYEVGNFKSGAKPGSQCWRQGLESVSPRAPQNLPVSPLPWFIWCQKSSGTAHLGDEGAARGSGESGTHRKTQWVTEQGLKSPRSCAVEPQGPGHTETRRQPHETCCSGL